MKGIIIKNSNGLTYEVLATKGEYTLLKCTDENIHSRYVVVWFLREYADGYAWGQGNYFSDIKGAKKCYNNKVA